MRTGIVSITIHAICLLASDFAVAETVRVLDRNADAIAARLALIDQASHSLAMAYYSVDDSTVSREIFAHLRQAAQRGVCVQVLVDACFNDLSGAWMRELRASGIRFREYHSPCWVHPCRSFYRLHDKLLIADGEAVILGGRNLEDHYFGVDSARMFRDRDILITGRAARHAAEYFGQIWNSKHVKEIPETTAQAVCRQIYEPPRLKHIKRLAKGVKGCVKTGAALLGCETGSPVTSCTKPIPQEVPVDGVRELSVAFTLPPGHVRFLHSSKVASEEPDITDDLMKLIASARRRIVIETPYLLLTDRLEQAFREAVQRGVTVQITTNSVETTDGPLAQAAYLTQRGKLLRNNLSLWEYQEPHMLHSKSWVVDDVVLIGSYNLDPRADIFDTQSCVIVYCPELAERLLRVMRNERTSFAVPVGIDAVTFRNSFQRSFRSRRSMTTFVLRGVAPLIWFQL